MNVNKAPAMDRARIIADPFVYLGPSVLGNKYPDPILRGKTKVKMTMETTDETAWAQATAKGTATALRDSLPALLAAQVTINGVATRNQLL